MEEKETSQENMVATAGNPLSMGETTQEKQTNVTGEASASSTPQIESVTPQEPLSAEENKAPSPPSSAQEIMPPKIEQIESKPEAVPTEAPVTETPSVSVEAQAPLSTPQEPSIVSENAEISLPPIPVQVPGQLETVNTADGGVQNLKKSSTIGIVVGIMFLISIVVGASLYYYFKIYTKTPAVAVTPPVTLITPKEPETVQATSTPDVPAPVDQTPTLLAEIDAANRNLDVVDSSMVTLEEETK